MKMVALGKIVSVVGGGTPRKSAPEYYGGPIPWVTPKDMKRQVITSSLVTLTQQGLQHSPAKLVPKDTVLVVVRSGVLKHTLPVALTGVPVTLNQDMKGLIPGDAVHGPYLARLVKALEPTVLGWVRATTADNFPIDKLLDFEISLPSLDEQRRIAAILDHADALRSRRRHVLSTFDSLRESVFIDMFGHPSSNAHGLPTGTVKDLVESTDYGTSEKSSQQGDIAVLRMNNITYSGEIDLKDLKYMDLPVDKYDRYTVRSGDVLFNRTNSADLVGKTAVYHGSAPLAYAGYLVRLRVREGFSPDYLSGVLNSAYGKATLRGMCKSIVGMANINAKEVQTIRTLIPSASDQGKYAERVEAIRVAKSQHTAALEVLDELFASLQARAFRGEL
ncbi:type I DNA specificity S subunit [Mycobacterium sp. TNTM28]|uniref:Type I DNA specificity S subunit n=2 Tax=[Mycobacterium] fortunisiensis TaxID=2600579 RepID=A0ABS6KQX9_9MYCO|nr:type I DNA specificity S subunit [[Mycobacterium] fortunisiensis]